VDAGIRSFKIEGRYKDMATVKNVTAHYRQLLDDLLEGRPGLARASSGRCRFFFTPDPDRGFNRGATDYFVNGRQIDIGAFDTPKHAGLPLGRVLKVGADHFDVQLHDADDALHNGDALTWWDLQGELQGVPVNVATPLGGAGWRVAPNLAPGTPLASLKDLRKGTELSRNRDMAWERLLAGRTAERRVAVTAELTETPKGLALALTDEDGHVGRATVAHPHEPARQGERALEALRTALAKLGDTMFEVRDAAADVRLHLSQPWFVPASVANGLRRDAVAALEAARAAAWQPLPRDAAVEPPVPYPEDTLSYLANVYNQRAAQFYARHGVKVIGSAYESHETLGEVSLMITKHCVRWSLSLCPKQAKGVIGVQGTVKAEPMTLVNGNDRLTLRFDCKPCEMHVVGKIRKNVLKEVAASPITFYRQRPVAKA
jgi:putative protease